MTDRIPLDELTSDALDQLYADLAEARAEQGRFRTMYDASEARVNDLIDERDKLDRQLTTMTDVAKGNKRHVQMIVPELESATQRAERYRSAWTSARERATAHREGTLRHVADRDTWKGWAKQAEAEREDLRAQLASRTVLLEGHLTAQTDRANRAEAERGDLLVKLAAVREDRDRWREQSQTWRTEAHDATQRAEKAEALLRRYVQLADVTHTYPIQGGHDCLGTNLTCAGCTLRDAIRAALDQHQEQAPAPAVHTGGNAEDCPACEGANPPYPFLCPGPTT